MAVRAPEKTEEAVEQQVTRLMVTFSVIGRVRFLSHLEVQGILLGAFRRCGVKVALSNGMRPKPRIKLVMPRPVAVEAWAELAEIVLEGSVDPDQIALKLQDLLPIGMTLTAVEQLSEGVAGPAKRVAGAWYQFHWNDEKVDPEQVIRDWNAAGDLIIERKTPKQHKMINVTAMVPDIMAVHESTALRAWIPLTDTGSARPAEVSEAIRQLADEDAGCGEMRIEVIREQIVLRDAETGEVTEEAVGAEVPEGPPKPWGAC